MSATNDPQSFQEATESKYCEKWVKAMTAEMESLVSKDVFDLFPLPEGKKAIGCRWAYKTKRKVDGSVEKHRAQLLAEGYLQRKGLDYHET